MHEALNDLVRAWEDVADDDDFLIKLRNYSVWDEEQFKELFALSERVLRQIEGGEPITDEARAMLDRNIRMAIELTSHPGFRAEPPPGMSKEGYDRFLDERIATFARVRDAFLAVAG